MAASPASNRTRNNSNNNNIILSSYFQKTVTLHDWWLIKADNDFQEKRLAVAGFTSREQQALRVFHSAPIAKRYDAFTLETGDGIAIVIQGFINRARTIENGFSSEIFNHFLFGFPLYWEEYAKKCLERAITSGIDLQHTSDLHKSTTDPVSAITGTKDSSPMSTPNKHKCTAEDRHNIKFTKDGSLSASEKFTVDALKDSNMHNYVANFRSSVEQNSDINTHSSILNNNCKGMAESSMFQSECHPSFLESTMYNVVDNVRNDASKSISPLSSCHVNAISSMEEDNMAMQPEPSSHHVVGPSERIDDSESSKKSKKRFSGKSKTKGSTSVGSITINNNASVECSVPKSSNFDNVNASNFDLMVSAGTSSVSQIVCRNMQKSSKKKQKEHEGNKDGAKSRNTDFLTASLPSGPEAVLQFIDENGLIHDDSLCRSPAVGDSNTLKHSANHLDDTMMFSPLQSGAGMHGSTPSLVERDAVNVTPNNFGSRRTNKPMRNLKDNKRQKPVSGFLVKCKNKELMSEAVEDMDEEKQKSSTTLHPPAKVDILAAMTRAARRLRNLSGSSKGTEKNSRIVEEGGSSRKKPRRKINFDTYERKEKRCILSPESLSLKRSRSGRLLLPTLDFWRNQIPVYDADRNITGIQEELDALKPTRGTKSEPHKKQKRRQFA